MTDTYVSAELLRTLARRNIYAFVSSVYIRTARMYRPYGVESMYIGTQNVRALVKQGNSVNLTPRMEVSQLFMRRLYRTQYPEMAWLDDDMFLDDLIFPVDISYDSEAAEVFSTEVSSSDSGVEQRVGMWDQPKMEYDVAYGVRTMEQLHELKRIFRVARGQKHAFRFRDPVDYTSSFAVGEEARAPDAITPYDQVIGVGDGTQTSYQLVKNYDIGGLASQRIITRPERGTVVLAVNGHQYPADRLDVDYTTGLVNILPRFTQTLSGEIVMTRVSTTERRIAWPLEEQITDLYIGDWVSIAGFDGALNRVTDANAWQITNIDNDAKTISFVVPDGHDTSYGVTETKVGATVAISVISAPPNGAQVTAGYQFHVPVRFSTDRLPINLETYGVGSANNVTLSEVRGEG